MGIWQSNQFLIYYLIFLIITAKTYVALGANWAQTFGVKKQQTSLVPPSPFKARYGHACVVLDAGPSAYDYMEEAVTSGLTDSAAVDSMYCIGGDDFDEIIGGGGLKNDVWKTTGINFRIAKAQTILNEYDDPKVTTVSDMSWQEVSSGKLPTDGNSYLDWIACSIEDAGFNPPPGVSCRVQNFDVEVQFSPRRHHAAVSFRRAGDSTTRIYVLGGRSRVLVDYPDGWERVHGGFMERGVYFREENALMNDIWVSPSRDNAELTPGEDWGLVNPGCITLYSPFSLPEEDYLWLNGSAAATCETDDDCGGDATCDIQRSVCVCNLWTPREQHAVAVYKNKLYVSGGFTWLDQHTCGASKACGGGYRQVLNDVWWSTDAYSWTQVGYGTPAAEWSPRAGHQLIVPFYTALFSSAEDQLMYVVGGQTLSMTDSNTTEFLADVWATADGAQWFELMSADDARSFPPRSNHFTAMIDDVMVVTGGYNSNGGFSDTWTWDRGPNSVNNDQFIQDFSNQTDFVDYVDQLSAVSVIPMVNEVNEQKLNSLDIYTIEDLAYIASWKVKMLQDFHELDYPDICLHIKWAESILDNCIAVIEPLDYVEWDGVFVREDDWDAALKVNQTKSEAQITEETDFCSTMFLEWTGSWTNYILFDQEKPYPFPLKCKSQVGKVAIATGAIYQDRVWLVGGKVNVSISAEASNNVWYREPNIPKTTLITKPQTQTSDQLFEFSCSDSFASWCRYQYRILDMSTTPPVETRHWADCDYQVDFGQYWSGGWLPRGDYRLQVRAVGPSGNKESSFEEGRNQHTWTHIPIPPWNLIISIIVFVFLLILAIIVYFRYKARKAALQRYAMKRMRRKFKRMQKIKAGKLHKSRQERAKEAKSDAVVKEIDNNTKREANEVQSGKRSRRRRSGPAVKSTTAVATEL